MNVTPEFWQWGPISSAIIGGLAFARLFTAPKPPTIRQEAVAYSDDFASGSADWSVFNPLAGAARWCLRVRLTDEVLWVTAWFPFSLFSAISDLDHVIPLEAIHSAEPARRWLKGEGVEIYFHDKKGRPHRLFLVTYDRKKFLRELDRVRF